MIPSKRIVTISLLALIALGVYFRLYNITDNQLFYYDEGHYLTIHRAFDEALTQNPPASMAEFFTIMKHNLYLSLRTGKGLWFFLSHLRGFFGLFDAFYFPKVLAAIFGILSIGVVYLFARQYFQSKTIALLSAAFLAILPSHVYYSRLGLQETLSALCLLCGLYFYLFPKKFGYRTIIASVMFALAYFSNYRMFIIPILVGFAEIYIAFSERIKFNIRKFAWSMVIFGAIVVYFGLLNDAGHFNIIFFWMLRQGESAKGAFQLVNFLSYPYAIFRLETILFGLLLFSNVYFFLKKQWSGLLPFFLVLLHIGIFSFAHEKGVRYLCVIMPFMAMAAAFCAHNLVVTAQRASVKKVLVGLIIFMCAHQVILANAIRGFQSDYLTSMREIQKGSQEAKVMSTQAFVQNLYSPKRENVVELPHKFRPLVGYFLSGYQYIVIGPQAYISYTKSDRRFDPELEDHLEFILKNIQPIHEYDHFNQAMMERFILEHNEDLKQTISFLNKNKNGQFNKLRVFKSSDYVEEVFKRLERLNQ